MTLLEIKAQNDKILAKALKINKKLENCQNLNIDIEKCKDGILFYTVIASCNAQQKAPMGEKFLCDVLNMTRILPSKGRGDAVDKEGKYYEFKNSFTNEKQNLNIRQIRLWQNIDFYYCIYINEENLDESLFFILTKEQMEHEVELCGGYTHGTIEANVSNQNKEYSITIPVYNDKNEKTKRCKNNYLSNSLKEKILYGNR